MRRLIYTALLSAGVMTTATGISHDVAWMIVAGGLCLGVFVSDITERKPNDP